MSEVVFLTFDNKLKTKRFFAFDLVSQRESFLRLSKRLEKLRNPIIFYIDFSSIELVFVFDEIFGLSLTD